MKIRKSAMKGRLFVLILFSAFLFQGCGNSDIENVVLSKNLSQEKSKEGSVTSSSIKKEDTLLHFFKDVSEVKVTHSNGGGQKSWNMDKKDIPQFREWALSLQVEHQNFEKGESPGEINGVDAYTFCASNDTEANFVYIDIGNNNHYIKFEGKWYLITNHESIPDFLPGY